MDRFTKMLLTLITGSLLWISLQLGTLVPNAFAATDTVRVEIVDVRVAKHRNLPVEISGQVNCTP